MLALTDVIPVIHLLDITASPLKGGILILEAFKTSAEERYAALTTPVDFSVTTKTVVA